MADPMFEKTDRLTVAQSPAVLACQPGPEQDALSRFRHRPDLDGSGS